MRVWASYSPTVNGQGLYTISPLRKYGCLLTKSEMCCYAQTILLQVLEEYLDIHNDIFQIEGAMAEWMIVCVNWQHLILLKCYNLREKGCWLSLVRYFKLCLFRPFWSWTLVDTQQREKICCLSLSSFVYYFGGSPKTWGWGLDWADWLEWISLLHICLAKFSAFYM